jgi:hopene-associated glycosyltransferase HpnB
MILASLSTLIWLLMLLWPAQAWRMNERLTADPGKTSDDAMTVLIPARNEADTLPTTLDALSRQKLPLAIRVLDDGSTDGTCAVAAAVPGLSLVVERVPEPPAGWMGKLWALQWGLRRVETEWLLLLDADIALEPGTLPVLLNKARAENLDFLSVMASPYGRGFWDCWLMPVFIYFFKWVYPFRLSNCPRSGVAAAAGGCVLTRRQVIEDIGGFDPFRGAVIDDCTLARAVKKRGFRTWIGVSRDVRMQRAHRFSQIWQMVVRTAYAQLAYSPLLLGACTLALAVVFLAPPVLFLIAPPPASLVAGVAWLLMMTSEIPIARFYGQWRFAGFFLPVAALLFLAMTWHSAFRYGLGIRTRWKGRSYSRRDFPGGPPR